MLTIRNYKSVCSRQNKIIEEILLQP